MLTWRLNEVMARHRISNKLLAEKLQRHETSISRMRTADEMPRFSGAELSALCDALSAIAGVRIGPSDLLEG
ncbi:MAG: helix-turn-helix transcriptional regulator [Nodosilinea sp. WJT8-NPBG4]|nr:helix-turn-helix transcriptional regulator [Nodosilinea sp. WJT8-NPBG4]